MAFVPTVGRPKDQESLLEQRVRLMEREVHDLLGMLSQAHQKIALLEGREPQLAMDELLQSLERMEAARLERERAQIEQDRETVQREAEQEKKRKQPSQRGHGPRPQQALAKVEQVHELDAGTACEVCGGELVAMGEQFEESEEIHSIERQYVCRVVRRRKYRCRCQACVVTAPAPPRIVPSGRYSNDFIIQVAADKWLDHVPLERQSRIMDRQGVEVDSHTLYDQTEALARLLEPVYHALGKLTLAAPVLHADETRWPRLDAKASSNWTVWTRTTPRIAHYAILPSKSHKAAEQLFRGYQGIIVVDGYAVYECLARDDPGLQLANCWAHVLRKFRDIEETFPKECHQILGSIGKLYEIEGKVEGAFPGDAAAQSQRLDLRRERSAPVIAEIRQWCCTSVGLPRSALGQAVRYLLKRWEALTRFLENPQIPLDNNAAERSLRGPVIGRKVHYGSKSKRGTEVAAIFYTFFESAKLNEVEPVAYLRAVVGQLLRGGEILLPWDFEPSI
ncbi:MAG: IS66 family transposase [Aquincola sp.]|nr:IS66 family transposase [Aquincola sp.]